MVPKFLLSFFSLIVLAFFAPAREGVFVLSSGRSTTELVILYLVQDGSVDKVFRV